MLKGFPSGFDIFTFGKAVSESYCHDRKVVTATCGTESNTKALPYHYPESQWAKLPGCEQSELNPGSLPADFPYANKYLSTLCMPKRSVAELKGCSGCKERLGCKILLKAVTLRERLK